MLTATLRTSFLLVIALCGGCAISGGELPISGGIPAEDLNVVSGMGVDGALSALYAVEGDEVLVILVDHPDFCPLWQGKGAANDGDLCVDSAGHPPVLYLAGLTVAGGTYDASDIDAHLLTDGGPTCEWEGQASTGSVQLSGAPGSFEGTFALEYASTSIAGAFGELVECPGIPDWF